MSKDKKQEPKAKAEEPKAKTLRDLSLTELKAAAFDKQMEMQNLQQMINAIVAEINRRLKQNG